MILPDVNVLPYAFRRDFARHAEYRAWLEDVVNGQAACTSGRAPSRRRSLSAGRSCAPRLAPSSSRAQGTGRSSPACANARASPAISSRTPGSPRSPLDTGRKADHLFVESSWKRRPGGADQGRGNQGATSWSPDGSTVAFYDVGDNYDIFTLKPGASPVRFLETTFREQGPAFSPDGRWLAYSSNETGRPEIYLTPYPGPGGKIAISTGGGRSPRWSSNGRELFFRNGRQMLVVAIEPGAALGVGTPRVLFEGDYVQESDNQGSHQYDVQNFFEELKRLAPVD